MDYTKMEKLNEIKRIMDKNEINLNYIEKFNKYFTINNNNKKRKNDDYDNGRYFKVQKTNNKLYVKSHSELNDYILNHNGKNDFICKYNKQCDDNECKFIHYDLRYICKTNNCGIKNCNYIHRYLCFNEIKTY